MLTVGTLTDPEMLVKQPNASYVMAIVELPFSGTADHTGVKFTTWVGMAAVDCASGRMLVGQWHDDELRTQLRAQLAALQPVELILPKVWILGGVGMYVCAGVVVTWGL